MPGVKRSQASEVERGNIFEAGLQTQTALRTAMRLLKARQTLTGDPDESRLVTVALLDLESQVAKIQADLIAFMSDQRAIRPPSDADVEAVRQVALRLDAMTANAVLTNGVLALTTDVVRRWSAV